MREGVQSMVRFAISTEGGPGKVEKDVQGRGKGMQRREAVNLVYCRLFCRSEIWWRMSGEINRRNICITCWNVWAFFWNQWESNEEFNAREWYQIFTVRKVSRLFFFLKFEYVNMLRNVLLSYRAFVMHFNHIII